MKKQLISAVALMLAASVSEAKVRLPHLIGDNMVIQQQSDVRLWGWDKAGETVTVRTSWSGETATAKVGKDGKWLLTVKSPAASYTPLSITFSDSDGSTTINNEIGRAHV